MVLALREGVAVGQRCGRPRERGECPLGEDAASLAPAVLDAVLEFEALLATVPGVPRGRAEAVEALAGGDPLGVGLEESLRRGVQFLRRRVGVDVALPTGLDPPPELGDPLAEPVGLGAAVGESFADRAAVDRRRVEVGQSVPEAVDGAVLWRGVAAAPCDGREDAAVDAPTAVDRAERPVERAGLGRLDAQAVGLAPVREGREDGRHVDALRPKVDGASGVPGPVDDDADPLGATAGVRPPHRSRARMVSGSGWSAPAANDEYGVLGCSRSA